ncbi:MAG: VOC family protein [Proteobacteria bacterium]|nr:VOC family protein [Pseudomonadota bacterium]
MTQTEEKPKVIRGDDLQAITPHLVCAGAADAIEFYKKAFGAVEKMRLAGRDGKLMHGAIKIGNASVMLVDESPDWGSLAPTSLNGTPVTIHLYVADVDAFIDRAVKAGATLRMAPADMFWGDRYGIIEDPFGHKWSIATHQRDMTADEIEQAMKSFMPSADGCDS